MSDTRYSNQDFPVLPINNRNMLSTSLLKGGIMSINGSDPAKLDITATFGIAVNSYTDVLKPEFFTIETPFTTQAPDLSSGSIKLVYLESLKDGSGGGKFVFRDSGTPEDERDGALLGFFTHTATEINVGSVTNATTVPSFDIPLALSDFSRASGDVLNFIGNVYSGRVGDLQLKKTSGILYALDVNKRTIPKNPNFFTTSAEDPVPLILYGFKDGSGGFKLTTGTAIVPGIYDDGTGGVSLPTGVVGVDEWKVDRVVTSRIGLTALQFGQAIYKSAFDAYFHMFSEDFEYDPNFRDSVLRSFIITRGDHTSSDEAIFINFDRQGVTQESGGGIFKILNENDMASDSEFALATQKSIKAFGSHDRQFVIDQTPQLTTLINTFEDITSAFLTTKDLGQAGNYVVTFTAIMSASVANTIARFRVLVNGAPIAMMPRSVTLKTNNTDLSPTFIGIATGVLNGDTLQIQFETNKGVLTLAEFNLLVDGIPESRVIT